MILIHRLILKELFSSFLISILFLNFTLMMEKLLRLSRMLSGGAAISDIAEIIIYLQPHVLINTIPMSVLLSILLTYGRMNADNELIILRSSGMSFRNISRPVLYLGLIGFAISILMSFYFGPKGNIALREKITEVLTVKAPMTIEEGVFNTSFKDIVIMVREKTDQETLSGIIIIDERKKGEQKVIFAKNGKLIPDNDSISFSLTSGHIYITKGDIFTDISFGRYYFRLSPFLEQKDRKSSEFTPSELLKASKEYPDKRIAYLLEFHKRLSMPALCLISVLLGPPLSLLAGKSGRLGGLTIGLSVFGIYYTLLIYGENLAKAGKLSHISGAWLSFAVLCIISLFIFERINKR